MDTPLADAREIEVLLSLLDETPRRCAAVAAGHDDPSLARRPVAGEWSAVEILGHLRGCADVWPSTIRAMLAEDEPYLPLHAPRAWTKKRGYALLDFHASLAIFRREREELLTVLSALPLPAWERGAWIGGRRHTVFSQARRLGLHEQAHCAQLERLLGS